MVLLHHSPIQQAFICHLSCMAFFNLISASKLLLSWIIPAAVLLLLVTRRKKSRMPPGPFGIPIFGSLFSLKAPVYKSMKDLAKIYGPIMTVKFGAFPNVIISNSKLAKEVLKTHDNVLASRPPTVFSSIMISSGVDMVWSPLGHQWQENRKLVNTELLSANSLKKFKETRQTNIAKLIEDLRVPAENSTPVVMRKYLWNVVVNNMSRMVMGSHYSGDKFEAQEIKQIVSDTLRIGNLFNLGDFIPFLSKLDSNGYTKSIKQYKSTMDRISYKILADYRSRNLGSEESFVNTLLQLNKSSQIDDPTVGNMIWNMMAAGTDTIAGSTEWAIAELLIHADKQAKVQREIDLIVGRNRNVEEEDLDKLKYLNWVYKETLRLHPPTAMMLPHYSTQDCNIAGFDIPANTAVHVNVFAINRDPDNWENPEQFMPERFEKEDVDMRGYDFRLLPFGAGRRICPGARMAILSSTLILANLLQKYDLLIPRETRPQDVDMVEEFGIVQCMKTPVSAVLRHRA